MAMVRGIATLCALICYSLCKLYAVHATPLQGWYERRPPCTFKQIIDTQFVAAMGPPGGGRNPITNRLLRHFNMLTMTDMSDESCRRIFTTILGSFVSKHFNEKVVPSLLALIKWQMCLFAWELLHVW